MIEPSIKSATGLARVMGKAIGNAGRSLFRRKPFRINPLQAQGSPAGRSRALPFSAGMLTGGGVALGAPPLWNWLQSRSTQPMIKQQNSKPMNPTNEPNDRQKYIIMKSAAQRRLNELVKEHQEVEKSANFGAAARGLWGGAKGLLGKGKAMLGGAPKMQQTELFGGQFNPSLRQRLRTTIQNIPEDRMGMLAGGALTAMGANVWGDYKNYRRRQAIQNLPWTDRLGLALQLAANPAGFNQSIRL